MVEQTPEEHSTNLTDLLDERIQLYREENRRLESFFTQCGLLDSDGKLDKNLEDSLDQLNKLQNQFNTKELDANAMVLSYLDNLAGGNNHDTDYFDSLKIQLKHFTNLDATVSAKIAEVERDLSEQRCNLDSKLKISSNLDDLKGKIRNYESQMAKFEGKSPILKEFNLLNISKEIDTIATLKRDTDNIQNELARYCDLKPDLDEAVAQLNQLKLDYEKMNEKLSHV